KLPDKFFRKVTAPLGFTLPALGSYGVAMVFLPRETAARNECEKILEKVVRDYGMVVLGWRDVPVDNSTLGAAPKDCEPKVRQLFISMGDTFYNRADFNRRLYLVRQRAENIVEFEASSDEAKSRFYICGFSTNRIVYKGMFTAHQVRNYYPDLSDPDF